MYYYESHSPTFTVDVLGTPYRLYIDVPSSEDAFLTENAGYCDETSHIIAICRKEEGDNIDDFDAYQRRVVRHELIHAHLYESGLGSDAVWCKEGQTHPEQMVDWIARQFPRLLDAFCSANAL